MHFRTFYSDWMIEIQLNKPHYFPSNTIEGQVKLKTAEQVVVKFLKLRFYRKHRILLKKIDGSVPEIIFDEEKIIRENFYILGENCELEPGEHSFPFILRLKYEENGTGKMKGYFYDSVCNIENICMLEGSCSIDDMEHIVEKTVSIFDKHEEKQQTDLKIKTSTFFCLFDHNVLYRVMVDKLWYVQGDKITVECFPVSKTTHPLVAGISGKLYQLVLINQPWLSTVKSKLMLSSNGFPHNKNKFKLQFRIPMNAGPSITEMGFTVKMVLFLELRLYNGAIMKIKKYLNIGESSFEVPEIEQRSFVNGTVFAEKVLKY